MINKDYLKKLKEVNFSNSPKEQSEGILFGFLIENMYEFPELETVMFKSGIFPYDRFTEYQIQLCKTNQSGNLELITPLSGYDVQDDYYDLCLLLSHRFVGSTGHVNNILDFSIYDDNNDKEAIKRAKEILPDFNLEKAAIIISDYYEKTQFAKKFAGYVGSNNFIMDYKNYVK